MYEAKKVADWTNKMAKIEEASRKKDELNNEFMVQTRETLINKMGNSEGKREAILTDMKEKLKVVVSSSFVIKIFSFHFFCCCFKLKCEKKTFSLFFIKQTSLYSQFAESYR